MTFFPGQRREQHLTWIFIFIFFLFLFSCICHHFRTNWLWVSQPMAAEPVGASGLMTPWEIKQILSHAVCEMAIVPPSLSSSFISFSMLFLFTLQFWLYFSLPMSTSVIRSHHRFKTQTSTTFSSIPSYFLSLPNLPSAPLSRIWRYRRRG